MRTKALFVAAFLAAGLASSMAQNVYSLNVVGYYNVTVPASSFALIANQLDTTNNTLKSLIPTAPDGTQFFKYTTGSGWATFTYDELEPGWLPNGDASLAPGEGGFIKNNTTAPLTVTFVGEVKQGALTTAVPAGYAVRSSQVPQAGNLTALGFPGADGDQVFKYTAGTGYSTSTYDELEPGWLPSEPSIGVGESFFSRKGAATDWVRNFTVPQ